VTPTHEETDPRHIGVSGAPPEHAQLPPEMEEIEVLAAIAHIAKDCAGTGTE